MNIIAFIPARSNSKSIPQKNIKPLGGKPLLVWSIETAQKCGLRVIVSTDSDEIAKVAEGSGAEVIIRPTKLAQDNIPMYEVLKSEVPKINPKPELVMLLQPTSPFRKSVHIKTAISYFTENLQNYDSLISVEKIPDKYNPAQVIINTPFGKGLMMGKLTGLKDKIKSYFTGIKYTKPKLTGYPVSQRLTLRQDHPEAWIPDGAIYLFKTSNLPKGSIYGDKVMLLESEGTININSQEDFEKAELYANNRGN